MERSQKKKEDIAGWFAAAIEEVGQSIISMQMPDSGSGLGCVKDVTSYNGGSDVV
jgi:hypothetical protein